MSRSTKEPFEKDGRRSMAKLKRIHNRRYRRVFRQDVKQWRYRYEVGCHTCDCIEELWDDVDGVISWPVCLSFELEPSYDHPKRWIDKYDICDYKAFVSEDPLNYRK